GFQRGIHGFSEIVPEQHIFGRNRAVGLELEHPVSVRLAVAEERLRRRIDARLKGVSSLKLSRCCLHLVRNLRFADRRWWNRTTSAHFPKFAPLQHPLSRASESHGH